MARLGSIAAAPFLGDQFVSLYLGATRVPTVPGRPTITSAVETGFYTEVAWAAPVSDGGSTVTAYRVYVNGLQADSAQQDLFGANTTDAAAGDIVQAAAINSVGEGPKSEPFEVA